MFALTIVSSDAFLEMPTSARLLYYDLGMRADDDGFINAPKSIMKMTGASDDDLRLLIAKKFVIPFDKGIVVIKHWNINNYIQKDRYTETVYKEEKALLKLDTNKTYHLIDKTYPECIQNGYEMDTENDAEICQTVENPPCIQNVYKMDTQVRTDKDSIDKVSKGKEIYGTFNNVKLTPDEFQKLIDEYGDVKAFKAIEYLSAYREEKGYKNRSDYLSIRRWVISAVEEHELKSKQKAKSFLDA